MLISFWAHSLVWRTFLSWLLRYLWLSHLWEECWCWCADVIQWKWCPNSYCKVSFWGLRSHHLPHLSFSWKVVVIKLYITVYMTIVFKVLLDFNPQTLGIHIWTLCYSFAPTYTYLHNKKVFEHYIKNCCIASHY